MTIVGTSTLSRIAEEAVAAAIEGNDTPQNNSLLIGTPYLIRTVTWRQIMMYTGLLTRITETDLILNNAACVESGRYSDALRKGILSRVDPYPGPVIVFRAGLIDAAVWDHELPLMQN